MKKSFCHLLLFLLFFSFSSCLKPKHSIRVNNQNSRTLNVLIESNNYGLVSPGKTTSYQNIPEGTSQLGGDLKGSVNVSGKGTHKWTLTITASGSFAIAEDK